MFRTLIRAAMLFEFAPPRQLRRWAATLMNATGELAGFFAAHAVWCVSDGETLVPILACESSDGSRQMERIEAEQLQDAVRDGKDRLATNPESAARAVLVYDGFVTLNGAKTDALIIDAIEYGAPNTGFTMAVPYRHANDAADFAVFRPKFLGFEGLEPSWHALGEAFFHGVDRHEKGAAVWNASLDQSR